ncbi:NlpC/P60 family protein [Clostridium sp. A1-XYC3]|uniref:NlpC/P60 family protein n=1 Tax=Clostridium tanneri TaxID=3037988 RepID=A0ABU4JW68_9CLOT|nr:NlpC/P60 family protein [Clostridium sp. A1-XYC3]MDW8802419.1 NlpC/P60 family protein [Clostridium sp. A1-XYC3]
MKKKMLSAIIALTLAVSTSGMALAAPANSGSTSLKQVQNQRQELEIKVEKLDSQIIAVMKQIDDNKGNIDKIGKEIRKTQEELGKAEDNIKGQQNLFSKRVRAMYINGVDSYLNVVLEADDLGDLISRVENVKKVVNYDNNIVNDLKSKKAAISDRKQELNNQNNKLLSLKKDNESKLSKLNIDKSNQTKLISDLKDKEKILALRDTTTTNLVTSAQSRVQQVRDAAPRISRGTSSATAASSDSIVAYASNFLGTPYQWGGNGPNSFDCSGFTSYVYSHFGIGLPRIASDQQGVGTSVSRDQLQPGDLVFFGSPATHVGIYVGNNCYIHAPRTGDVVKISPLNRSDYSGARRVR